MYLDSIISKTCFVFYFKLYIYVFISLRIICFLNFYFTSFYMIIFIFLFLGIGIDDMFVIVQCWYNLSEEEKVGKSLHEQVSLVVEFYRWWVLKSKIFGQESTFFFKSVDDLSAKIVLSKSIFNVKNRPNFFKKKIYLRISI